MNAYTNVVAVKEALNITTSSEDSSLETYITGACRSIDQWCGQFFYDAGSASARTYKPTSATYAHIDPFHTTTGLVIKTDDNDDGTFEITWASTDYELDYFGGDMANMLSAPYDRIHAIGSYYFPTLGYRRRTLEVTARWGWAAIPPAVVTASELVSMDQWSRRHAPFGTTLTDFGPLRVSNSTFDRVVDLIGVFRRVERTLGIA